MNHFGKKKSEAFAKLARSLYGADWLGTLEAYGVLSAARVQEWRESFDGAVPTEAECDALLIFAQSKANRIGNEIGTVRLLSKV